MSRYIKGGEFLLNQDIDFKVSDIEIRASKESMVKIIDIDTTNTKYPYKVLFEEGGKTLYMSSAELDEITFSSLYEY